MGDIVYVIKLGKIIRSSSLLTSPEIHHKDGSRVRSPYPRDMSRQKEHRNLRSKLEV